MCSSLSGSTAFGTADKEGIKTVIMVIKSSKLAEGLSVQITEPKSALVELEGI